MINFYRAKESNITGANMSELVLLTLPIGNNQDITLRAKQVLIQSDYILAEDTRVFKAFCKHNDIETKYKNIDSFHDHTSESKMIELINTLKKQSIVLVSDAGSPIISDPAFPLVEAAVKNNIEIQSVPGVSSIIVALELSSLPPVPFHFHAFIPRDSGKKLKFAKELGSTYGTHIFFEGVSRVKSTLELLTNIYPNFDFCVARELTKQFQSIYRFKGTQWEQIEDEMVYKGEFVILLHNPNNSQSLDEDIKILAQQIYDNGIHPKKLSKLISKIIDVPTKEVYQKLQN